ncbi:hypothetical protein DESC_90031 [Desulfosarcina cetonica]|nr:hypothetical protein DESC_90031 [Desulfosarcina cetonica]
MSAVWMNFILNAIVIYPIDRWLTAKSRYDTVAQPFGSCPSSAKLDSYYS